MGWDDSAAPVPFGRQPTLPKCDKHLRRGESRQRRCCTALRLQVRLGIGFGLGFGGFLRSRGKAAAAQDLKCGHINPNRGAAVKVVPASFAWEAGRWPVSILRLWLALGFAKAPRNAG